MYQRKENLSLKPLNTFHVDAFAKEAIIFDSIDDAKDIVASGIIEDKEYLVLAGGSNILFTSDFDGTLLIPKIKGIEVEEEDKSYYWVKAYAGEDWDNFVKTMINYGWGGLENLSLIPGTVGASPIQNIGAYGVEVKDRISQVEYIDLETGHIHRLSKPACDFDYRTSIFKKELKGKCIILSVVFRLMKEPVVNCRYKSLADRFEGKYIDDISIQDVRDVVIEIRNSKLPDPKEIGNGGSFFKNPVIKKDTFEELKKGAPDIPYYEVSFDYVKIPAAYLIEKCGWKGFREKDAGVHEKQPLVLVNYGNSTGQEIFDLSEKIKKSVLEKYNIELEREINVV